MTENTTNYRVERASGVVTLTLNRPEQGNAIPAEAVPAIVELLQGAQLDPGIRVLLIRAEGKHFCSGADVGRFNAALDRDVILDVRFSAY